MSKLTVAEHKYSGLSSIGLRGAHRIAPPEGIYRSFLVIWQTSPQTTNLEAFGVEENHLATSQPSVQKSAGYLALGDAATSFFFPPAFPQVAACEEQKLNLGSTEVNRYAPHQQLVACGIYVPFAIF